MFLLAILWVAATQAPDPTQKPGEQATRSATEAEPSAEERDGPDASDAEPPPEPPPPPRPPPAQPNRVLPALVNTTDTAPHWTGTTGVGLISLTGNTQTITFNTNSMWEHKSERWIGALRGTGIYGRTRPRERTAQPQVLALAGTLQLRGERRAGPLLSGILLAGVETDHVKSVEFRRYGEGGFARIWINLKDGDLERAFLRTDLAMRVVEESRFQYYPTPLRLPMTTLIGPRFGGSLRLALSKDVKLLQDFEVVLNLAEKERTIVNTLSKVSARLTHVFSLATAFTLAYDSRPAAGKLPTDTTLNALLEVALP